MQATWGQVVYEHLKHLNNFFFVGKSTYLLNFIKDFNLLTGTNQKQRIIMISENEETSTKMKNICNDKHFIFLHYNIVPNINKIAETIDKSIHSIICIEDFMPIINKEKELDKMFNQFLLHSRHMNFSFILILHNLRYSMQKRLSFERSFLDQLDLITIFEPNTYKCHIYSFLKNLVDQELYQNLDNIFHLASTILKYPYILLTCKNLYVRL